MSSGKKIIIVVAVIAVLAIALYSMFAGNYNQICANGCRDQGGLVAGGKSVAAPL